MEPSTDPPDVYATAKERRGLDLETLAAALSRTLADRFEATDVTVTGLRSPEKAGTSSGTILFTASWSDRGQARERDLVIRTQPDQVQLYRDADFHRQYAVLDALHRSGRVRVPEPLFFESDPSLVGVPFFVMEQLHGNVPVTFPGYNVSGFLFDATPAQRRVAWETAVEELCRIALVPVDEMQFLDQPELGPTALEQQFAYWRGSVDWATGNQTPDVVWEVDAWLEANFPGDRPNGFAWGDARIGNMMFGDDFRLAGVMDWEAANLSGPRQDLAWWVYFDEFNSEARGVPRLDGLGTREETLAFWEDRVGEPVGDLLWYEVFTGFQITLFTFRTMTLLGGATDLEGNQGFQMTRKLLGW
jgi:aminoglycoside phosphotransferase (APT) family kinase protein